MTPEGVFYYTSMGYTDFMNSEIQKKIKNRLKRVEGQVRGIESMIDRKEYYRDITTQISAIKSALLSVENILIQNHLQKLLGQELDEKSKSEIEAIFNARK